MRRIRLLVIDENTAVREALETRLNQVPELELVASSPGHDGEDVLAIIRRCKPDVVLIECKRRDGRGLRLCQQMTAMENRPEIIILTSFIDDDERLATESIGVRRYLLKEIGSPALIGEIRAAYTDRRQSYTH